LEAPAIVRIFTPNKKIKVMSKSSEMYSKYGVEKATAMLCKSEDNDCVVRAVMNAFQVDYLDAHNFCENKLLRQYKMGTYVDRYLPYIHTAFNKSVVRLGVTRGLKHKVKVFNSLFYRTATSTQIKQIPMKVGEFVKANPTGNFLITVRGHAISLVNGVILGNSGDGLKVNREIISAYKIN